MIDTFLHWKNGIRMFLWRFEKEKQKQIDSGEPNHFLTILKIFEYYCEDNSLLFQRKHKHSAQPFCRHIQKIWRIVSRSNRTLLSK